MTVLENLTFFHKLSATPLTDLPTTLTSANLTHKQHCPVQDLSPSQ
jgi:ABC-type transport system involved in cytochrome c biogenesis ATPase subunit